ncbi:MAG: hypothetical protein LQ346_007428 [Caloplaca aetnensis]|nr:MAG: hypothetical protein LQ346_007428 [Caloplaca aetnensis]
MAGRLQSREDNEIQAAHRRLNLAPVSDSSTGNFFEVRKTGNRGLGCFARRHIPRGTRIHMEKALFSIRDVEDDDSMSPATREQLRQQLARLRLNQYRDFLALTFWNAEDEVGNRFQLNNFQMTLNDDGTSQQGIFVEAARFNHSCLPNAWFNWNPSLGDERRPQGRLTVHATRDIQNNGEILVNYQNPRNTSAKGDRRSGLHKAYNFQCHCQACGNNARARQGEQNRALMRSAEEAIKNNQGNRVGQRRALAESLIQLICLLDQEQLVYPQKATLSGDLADLYYRELGERSSFFPDRKQCWEACLDAARSRLDAEILCLGEDSEEVRNTLAWMAHLD